MKCEKSKEENDISHPALPFDFGQIVKVAQVLSHRSCALLKYISRTHNIEHKVLGFCRPQTGTPTLMNRYQTALHKHDISLGEFW